jgi:hypothetical protein
MSPCRCLWVEGPRMFEVTWCTAQFAAMTDNCLTLTMQITRSVETSAACYPTTQQHRCENLRSGINFLLSKNTVTFIKTQKYIHITNIYTYTSLHTNIEMFQLSLCLCETGIITSTYCALHTAVLSCLTRCVAKCVLQTGPNYCQAGHGRHILCSGAQRITSHCHKTTKTHKTSRTHDHSNMTVGAHKMLLVFKIPQQKEKNVTTRSVCVCVCVCVCCVVLRTMLTQMDLLCCSVNNTWLCSVLRHLPRLTALQQTVFQKIGSANWRVM